MASKINPVKVKQDADKLEKAGKLEQAIALYRQLVDDNPRDWNTVKKVGDLYARLNRNREAIDEWVKVADFFAKDGFLLKAIALWKQINKADPAALDPYLNLADLYAKQGLMMEAKSQYQIVVDEYVKRGKTRDAADVLRKMADIDPGDLKIRSRLADLYTRDGSAHKAVEEHIAIAEELNKKGHLAEALQVLEKGLKLDPKSARLRVELARIHLVQKNFERAVHYLEDAVRQAPKDVPILSRLGEAYLGARKIEEAEAIFKRLIELDPEDEGSRVQMGRVYLLQRQFDQAFAEYAPVVDKMIARREGERAAGLLQQIVQANGQHVKSLARLVVVYKGLRKDEAVVATSSRLTEAYINAGQFAEAAGALEELVALEPQNQQHKTKLQFVRTKLGGSPSRAPESVVHATVSTQPDEIEQDFDLGPPEPFTSDEPVFRPLGVDPAPPSAPARISIALSGALSEEDKEFIEEHLAEGKVFRKYGLVDKAADQFESVVARFPDNVEARQELREVHREKNELRKAAEQCLALAEIYRLRGDPAAAEVQEAEARKLAPEILAPVAASVAAPPPVPSRPVPSHPVPEPLPPSLGALEEEDIALETEEDIPFEVEEGGLENSSVDASDTAPDLPSLPAIDLEDDDAGQQDLPARFIDEEEPSAPEPPAFIAPAEESLSFGGEELALDEPAAPPPPPPPLVARAAAERRPSTAASGPASAGAAGRPGLPADIQRVLEEVDSYVAMGFVDDAKDALREVWARHPDHPAVLERVSELGLDRESAEEEAPAEEVSVPPYEAEDSGLSFDLEEPSPPPPPRVEPPRVTEEPRRLPAKVAEAKPDFAPSFASGLVDDPLDDLGLSEPSGELSLPSFGDSAPEELASEPGPEPSFFSSDSVLPESPPSTGGGIDLGAELGELFGTQSAVEDVAPSMGSTDLGDAGLEDIFKEFKKGVDKQLGKEDYDTRYNLGIAYKEMGLIDEAIAEFQLAAKDENRTLECSSMLGICFLDKGMPKLAVKWFEKGLKAPGRSDEEYMGLRYDLAIAHEAEGELDRAFALYTELYGQDATFRDVAGKVRELKAALG